ncbi:GNAT family N-acetyltransferase [Botryobacter ruber]|uniref:GNAT family N-acetyltransferase n=1 Tax=Botryobacter ruber TaxID=2171629 RepID=UPI000E0C14D2|nr:GNAT family N-acetyltransferase [Botryobacter ruber]
MNSNFHIRQATPADVPLLHQLAARIWEPTYCRILSKEQIDYMFEKIYEEEALLQQLEEGQVFLLLYAADQPIGFAAFSLKATTTATYKLNKLYLLPEAQGKGTGRKLLEAAEEAVRARGAKVLELNVNRHNPAKLFYETCGYTIAREEDIPIGPFWMNDFVMQKRLV